MPETRRHQQRGLKKKAALASGPKFREETPKKGKQDSDAIAILHLLSIPTSRCEAVR
jgi:hypothetical protein